MSLTSPQFKKLAIDAAQLADQKKAEDIVLLDLRKARSGVADYIVILSANSQTHLTALRDYIEDSLGQIGVVPQHKEGHKDNHWQVLDYGGLLVHLFHEGVRANYAIERLWEQAKEIPWNGNGNGNGRGKSTRNHIAKNGARKTEHQRSRASLAQSRKRRARKS